MGRPLNKKFFGPAGAGYEIVCNAFLTGGASEPAYIVEQRSNSKYRVAEVTATASTALTPGQQYTIVTVGGADYTTVGAANNTVGTSFTATGASAGGAGTARQSQVCIIVNATPTVAGTMQVVITPENATATVPATVTFTDAAGVVDAITSFVGGYGYWTNRTGIVITGGGGNATIDYQVSNGSIVAVQLFFGGTGYTGGTANIADAPAANPLPSNARIINARQVKSFNGITYDWPIVGIDDGAGPTGMPQADIGA